MISKNLGNITKYITSKCNKPTTMKLQKLVYISYCWYLTCYNKKLFTDNILAYKDGPVIEELFKLHRGARTFNNSLVNSFELNELSSDVKLILDNVLAFYGDKSGDELSELTHKPDTPWSFAKNNNVAQLDDEVIKNYYLNYFPQITMLPIIKDVLKLDLNFNNDSISKFIEENPTYDDRDRTYLKNNHPSHARLKELGIL